MEKRRGEVLKDLYLPSPAEERPRPRRRGSFVGRGGSGNWGAKRGKEEGEIWSSGPREICLSLSYLMELDSSLEGTKGGA